MSPLNRAHYQRGPAFGNQLLDYLPIFSVPTEIHLHSSYHILGWPSTYVYVFLFITRLLASCTFGSGLSPEWFHMSGGRGRASWGQGMLVRHAVRRGFPGSLLPGRARALTQESDKARMTQLPNSWDTRHVTKTGFDIQNVTRSQPLQLPWVKRRSWEAEASGYAEIYQSWKMT